MNLEIIQNSWKNAMKDYADGTELTVLNAQNTLKHEDNQKIIDDITEIRRNALHAIQDLKDAGLTVPCNIEDELVRFENAGSFGDADVSMNPIDGLENQTTFSPNYAPLPLYTSSWKIPVRQLGFGYKKTLGISESVRSVAEQMEKTLFSGNAGISVSVAGTAVPLYGYTNHPNRETETVTNWASSVSGVLTDVAKLRKKLIANSTPDADTCVLYVPYDWYAVLAEDAFANKGDLTFIERIKNYPEIKDVKPSKFLTDAVILVEIADRTILLAEALDIVTYPVLRLHDGEDQKFITRSACTPLIKIDRNGKTGIVHGTV